METYILQTLRDNSPDVAIIHAGRNDVRNRKLSSEQISRDIMQLGNICKDHQIRSIFISRLVCRNSTHLDQKIKSVSVADDGLHFK